MTVEHYGNCIACGKPITADEFEFFVPEDEEGAPTCTDCMDAITQTEERR